MPRTLDFTPSHGCRSSSGRCLCAAAWKTTCGPARARRPARIRARVADVGDDELVGVEQRLARSARSCRRCRLDSSWSSMYERAGSKLATCRHSSLPIEPPAPVTSTRLPATTSAPPALTTCASSRPSRWDMLSDAQVAGPRVALAARRRTRAGSGRWPRQAAASRASWRTSRARQRRDRDHHDARRAWSRSDVAEVVERGRAPAGPRRRRCGPSSSRKPTGSSPKLGDAAAGPGRSPGRPRRHRRSGCAAGSTVPSVPHVRRSPVRSAASRSSRSWSCSSVAHPSTSSSVSYGCRGSESSWSATRSAPGRPPGRHAAVGRRAVAEVVQRDEVHRRPDARARPAGRTSSSRCGPTPAGPGPRRGARRAAPAAGRCGRLEPGSAGQPLVVPGRDLGAGACHVGRSGELAAADGGLEVGHVRLEASAVDVVAPAAARQVAPPGVAATCRAAGSAAACSASSSSSVVTMPPSPMGRFLVA